MNDTLTTPESAPPLQAEEPTASGQAGGLPGDENPDPAKTGSPGDTARGRDAGGCFAPGNKGGPGNPYARQVALLKCAMLNAITPEDIAAIVQALIAQARKGDKAAARLVFTYALGRPSPAVDPDRLDQDEWQKQQETSTMYQEMPALVDKPAAELPLSVVRASRPAVAAELAAKFGQALADPTTAEAILCPERAKEDAGEEAPSPVGSNGDAWPAQNEATHLRYDHALRCAQGVPPGAQGVPPGAQGVPAGSNGEPAGDSPLPPAPLPLAAARGEAPSANVSNGDFLAHAWHHDTFDDYLEGLRAAAAVTPRRLKKKHGRRASCRE